MKIEIPIITLEEYMRCDAWNLDNLTEGQIQNIPCLDLDPPGHGYEVKVPL
jgi:hypothetical protein